MSANYKSATLSRRALTACVRAVSREETRYYLTGVCVEVSARSVVYAATNGHFFLATRSDLDKDAPANTALGTFIVPEIACRDKRVKARRGDTDDIEMRQVDGLMMVLGGEVLANCIDGTFPDWRRIVPTKISGNSAAFNASYLAELKKAGIEYGAGDVFRLSQNDNSPALVSWPRSNLFGIIMPMTQRDPAAIPSWFSEKVAA